MPPSIQDFQRRMAQSVANSSSLRNQGAPGTVNKAREFLEKIDLQRFANGDGDSFLQELDQQTNKLMALFPGGAKGNWGAARKVINLFLAEVYYHRFLCKEFGLEKIEVFLEIPLDRQVATYLIEEQLKLGRRELKWVAIKRVTPGVNKQYQDFALEVARQKGADWARVHLDIIAWRRALPST